MITLISQDASFFYNDRPEYSEWECASSTKDFDNILYEYLGR